MNPRFRLGDYGKVWEGRSSSYPKWDLGALSTDNFCKFGHWNSIYFGTVGESSFSSCTWP